MDNHLLDGFVLDGIIVEPLSGQYAGPTRTGHLGPRAVEVLLCLARNSRHLVTRDELLERVWGDGQGSADALTHAISELRHAFDDHANDPRFIQTVPRRGYRLLVEPVARTTRDEVPAPVPRGAERSLWSRLIRHGVIQAGAAYLVFGWLLIQVADATFENLGLPEWSAKFVTFVVIGGFPLVVLLSWFLEMAGGRMVRDHGQQAGGWLKGLERNYLAIVAAYALAVFGAGLYQLTVGFDETSDAPTLARETDEPGYIPVEANAVAVMRFLDLDNSPASRAFSDGLSEGIIDRLARLTGLRVASRGDSWSLPENATSDTVRRRLRVAYFVEGSVRLVNEELRVVAQLIDSATGRHIVSRQFDRKIEDHFEVQEEITSLIVSNLRVALPDDVSELPPLGIENVDVTTYVLYRQGMDALYQPVTTESLDAAAQAFKSALRIDPGFAVAHAGLCVTYLDRFELNHDASDVEAARTACIAAQETGGRLPGVYTAIGRLHTTTGDFGRARSAYESALELDPRDVEALRGLAFVFERQNDVEAAEQLLHEAIDLQPGNWILINSLASMMFEAGKYRDAADEFQRAAFLNPDNYVLLSNLGGALILAGDFDAATRVYEKSLKIEQNDEAYSNLGVVYYLKGDYGHAAEYHQKAVEAQPRSATSWSNLADTLYFAGERASSRQAYEKSLALAEEALAVNPRDAIELCIAAWANAKLGQAEDARQTIDRALQHAPNNPYTHFYDALIRTLDDDYDGAFRAAEIAMDLGFPRSMLVADPHLSSLRTETEYAELIQQGPL